jgi:hypothetical protein
MPHFCDRLCGLVVYVPFLLTYQIYWTTDNLQATLVERIDISCNVFHGGATEYVFAP